MMRSIRSVLAAGAIAALVATTAACSGSSDSGGAAAGSGPETVTVQVPPITSAAVVYLAQERGLFAAQGLDVEISVGQGGAAIAAALQAGGTDIGLSNYVTMINGMSNGLPVSLITELTRGQPGSFGLVVPENSAITAPADLRGKKIGVISTGSVSDLTTNARLAEVGLAPSDVNYVTVPLPNLLSALSSGQVDAVSVHELTRVRAIAEGNRLVLDGFEGSTADLAEAGLFASSGWAEENGDAVRRFNTALAEAARIANAEPDAVRALLPTYTSIDAGEVGAINLPRYVEQTDLAAVQKVSDLVTQFGMLRAPVDVTRNVVTP